MYVGYETLGCKHHNKTPDLRVSFLSPVAPLGNTESTVSNYVQPAISFNQVKPL